MKSNLQGLDTVGAIDRRFTRAALCWLVFLGPGCSTVSPVPPVTTGVPASARWSSAAEEARRTLRALAPRAVGISVAVAYDGEVCWSEAYGFADLEREAPATPDTLFRLYSLSKPMTAAAAARLLEEGVFDVDRPVQEYVPSFPDHGAVITPMHLATHTSGIRHYREGEARGTRHCDTVTEALAIFANDRLLHSPGERETYSSWGYVLLSAVLEGAAGLPYVEVMHRQVFVPLGMTSLTIDDPTKIMRRRSRFYRETERGRFVVAEPVDNTCKWGAGAWLGTAADTARFGLALVDESFLAPERQQLFTDGESLYRAQGWSAGGMAYLIADDARDIAVALVSNATGESLGPELRRAIDRVHDVFARSTQ